MDVLQENGKGDIPRITGEIEFQYDSEDMARAIHSSISVDNYQFVRCERRGKRIRCVASAETPSKLLHTIDDLLACVIVAEESYRTL